MAASFPFLHSSFLLDSDFLQNTTSIPPKMPYGLMDDIFNSNNCFYNNYLPSHEHDEILHQETDASCTIHHEQAAGIISAENNKIIRSPLSSHDENEQSMSEKYKTTTDSSSMVIQLDENDDEQEIHKKNTIDHQKKRRKNRVGSCLISGQSKDLKETKGKRHKKCNGGLKETDELEKKAKVEKKKQKVVSDEVPPTGYIHVRARRGQATDSHSLAERIRREKISERMKLLQSLVPGCDKVTGKALMLDEIINYVQSLQSQVEFLSMKLSSVNHPVFHDFGAADLDAFMVKSEKMNNLVSPLPSMQQSSTSSTTAPADQLTALADTTTTFSTRHNYPSLEFHQSHISNGFSSQVNENLLMDVDDQSRQMFINQSWFNHLCSFQ